eukprot:750502-Hanusia_phi.AAC.4
MRTIESRRVTFKFPGLRTIHLSFRTIHLSFRTVPPFNPSSEPCTLQGFKASFLQNHSPAVRWASPGRSGTVGPGLNHPAAGNSGLVTRRAGARTGDEAPL